MNKDTRVCKEHGVGACCWNYDYSDKSKTKKKLSWKNQFKVLLEVIQGRYN